MRRSIVATLIALVMPYSMTSAVAEETTTKTSISTKLRIKDLAISPDNSLALLSVDGEFPVVQTPKGPLSASTVAQAQLWLKDLASGEERLLASSTIPTKIAQGTIKVGDMVSEYVYWDPFISPDNNFALVTELQIPMKVTALRMSLGEWVIDTSYQTKDVRSKLLVLNLNTGQKWYPSLPFAAKSYIMGSNIAFSSTTSGFIAVNVRVSKPYFGRDADFASRYVMKIKLGAMPTVSLWKTLIGSGKSAETPWAVSPNGRFTTSWVPGRRIAVFNTQTKKSRYFSIEGQSTPTIRGVSDDGNFVLAHYNRAITLIDVGRGSSETITAERSRMVQNTFSYWTYDWDLVTSTLKIEVTMKKLVP